MKNTIWSMRNLDKPMKTMRYLWTIFLVATALGLSLMAIYTFGFYKGKRSAAFEYGIFFTYFTFISNIFCLINALLRCFKPSLAINKHYQIFHLLSSISITLTLLVYWAVLARDTNWSNAFNLIQTFFVHLLTPAFAITVFFYQVFRAPLPVLIKFKATFLINYIFPIAWLIVAITIYYALDSNKDAAIYGFLDFARNAWYLSLAYILGILIVFSLFNWLYVWLFVNKSHKAAR